MLLLLPWLATVVGMSSRSGHRLVGLMGEAREATVVGLRGEAREARVMGLRGEAREAKVVGLRGEAGFKSASLAWGMEGARAWDSKVQLSFCENQVRHLLVLIVLVHVLVLVLHHGFVAFSISSLSHLLLPFLHLLLFQLVYLPG